MTNKTMNYFELFELPSQFQLDGSFLSSQFRILQKRFHPDNFAASSERERLMAVQKASEINDAYQTLKHDIRRAEYLLSLHGIDLKDEQQTMQDPEFLIEQMTLREELEDIEQSENTEESLALFEEKVSHLYQDYLQAVANELSDHEWHTAANTVRKLKFIAKLKQEIERVEDSFFD